MAPDEILSDLRCNPLWSYSFESITLTRTTRNNYFRRSGNTLRNDIRPRPMMKLPGLVGLLP